MKIKKGIIILLASLITIGILPTTVFAEEEKFPTADWCPSTEKDHEHNYSEWTILTNPGCTTPGEKFRRCYFCNFEQYAEIPAKGHSFGPWHTVKYPTCTADGEERRSCTECGEEETRTIDAAGHSYGVWQIVSESTCISEGARRRMCSVCGYTQIESMPKLPHSYGPLTTELEATCLTSGVSRRTCLNCGRVERVTIDKLPHNVVNWTDTVRMTPFSYGRREGACTMCGHTQTEDIIPIGIIRQGDRGNSVRTLQTALNAAGYKCGYADGVFGGNTAAAVSAYEGAIGAAQDGIAWPGVQNVLYNLGGSPNPVGSIVLSLQQLTSAKEAYASGDELMYELTFTNKTGKTIRNWDLYYYENVAESDKLKGWSLTERGTDTGVAPNGKFTAWFKYKITDADVQAGGEALHWFLVGDLSSGDAAYSNTYDLAVPTVDLIIPGDEKQAEKPSVSLMMAENKKVGELRMSSGGSDVLDTAGYFGIISNTGEVPIAVSSLSVYLYPDTKKAVTVKSFDPAFVLNPGESTGFQSELPLSVKNMDPSPASGNLKGEIRPGFFVTAADPDTNSAYCDSETVSFTYKVYGE